MRGGHGPGKISRLSLAGPQAVSGPAGAGGLALSLETLKLQEEVIYERASKEKLDELNRLKTEFISTVSHELRTPLSSIQGLSELLQEGRGRDKVKRVELVGVLASESGRLSRLLPNILDLGKR